MERETVDKLPEFRILQSALEAKEPVYRLNLGGEKIERLQPGIEKLIDLIELNISDNQFHVIPNGVDSLVNLRYLDISKTSISTLKPIMHLSLKELRCDDTKLTKTQVDNFKQLHPECMVISNAKPVKQLSVFEKLFSLFIVLLLIGSTYGIITLITPNNEMARDFLIGFGLIFMSIVVAAALLLYVAKGLKFVMGK